MNKELLEEKLESLRLCVRRIHERCPQGARDRAVTELMRDYDAQDIISVNLMRAVQLCVDIAVHIESTLGGRTPATMGEAFDRLQTRGTISRTLADRMKAAVGFRNVAVHSYRTIDWAVVHSICTNDRDDFRDFALAVSKAMKIQE